MRGHLSVRIALLLCLLTASAAECQVLFNNFPVSGQISAFQVNSGYSVSNSFTFTSSSTLGEINFGAWVTTGDSVNGVAWSIGTTPFDTSLGSGVAGATSTYDLSNVDGFDVNIVSFAIPSLTLPAGTYYLTLSGATSAEGNPVYWDINDGAGVDAWDSTYGHVSAPNVCFQTVGISGTCASSFQILSTGAGLTAMPSSVTFPIQTINTTSSAQGVTITNNGAGAATINGIAITGANPGSFAQTNNCPISPATLTSSGVCTVNVTFTPTVASALSAAVTITGTNPVSVPLSGTGTQIPSNVTLLPGSLIFPGQAVNTPSGTQTVTLTNSGPSPLTIFGLAMTGANPGDFAQGNNCPISPATLAVNNSCMINVMFTPQASGARSAAVSITDNGSASPQSAGLSGTGLAPPPPWPNGYTYQATFTVAAGKVPSAQTNFPVLISGTYADFATSANGGRVKNACTQVVGNNSTAVPCDLIFTSDAAGSQLLSWEFETYAAATGAVNVWVNVPNLANGTVIYAWYGNPAVTTIQTTPATTWTNYMAVYHMKENPAGAAPQLNDSTANGNNAAMNGPVVAGQQQPGEIDGSINFEGNTWAGLASSSSLSFERTDSFSISGWYKIGSNTIGALLTKMPQPANAGWEFVQFQGASSPQIALGLFGTNAATGALAETPQVSMGVWHYMVATYSGTGNVAGMTIYIDGVQQTLTTMENNLGTSILNGSTPSINSRSSAAQESNDAMDEVRVSTKGIVYPAAWVTASYNNESSPGTFFGVSTGLTNSGTGPVASLTPSLSFPNTLTSTTSTAMAATLSNTGNAPLNNIVASITGTNPGDFALTTGANACGATLAAGSSCSIYVTFTPASAAGFAATLSVADNASGSPQTASLTGTGIAPVASLTPSLSFPNTLTSTTSAALAATLSNTGTAPLNNIVASITGANPSDFALTTGANACGATLAAGSSCSIYVTFTPASAASFSATLSVADSASGSPQTANLSGTGIAPVASLTPSLAFPNTDTGLTSAAMAATLSNTGTAPLNNIVASITGTNPGDFALTTGANACGATLAAGSSCSIYVTFTPASASSFAATLSVADSASGSPQTASLTGTGIAAVVSLTPSLSFPNTLSGTTSAAMAATLSNTGGAPLNNIVASITGANPSDFALTTGANACGATLAAGSSCSIYVTFTPASASSFSATLSVADSASGSPQTSSLTGTGIAPVASLTPSLSFPNTLTGTTSAALAATLSNTGTAPLNNIAASITGANPSDFALTTGANACGATLAAGSSCSIYVTFTPASPASFSATLSVADSASGSPQTSSLTGTGIAPVASLTPSLSFPNTVTGTTSAALAATLSNTGTAPLNNIAASITGANPSDFALTTGANACGATLAAGSNCSIYVTFKPASAASFSAMLSVADSASGSPQTSSLTGTGVPPTTVPWPNGYNYQATFTVAAGQVPSAQTNFPALISGTFADFATVANGGRIANTCTQVVGNNSTSVPCDLIFTSDAAGTQLLSWEFESWTPATGAANIWVNVPNIANGTVIYAWYGQPSVTTLETTPSSTWTNFMAVYHMKENPAGAAPQLNDSTGTGNNATMNGSVLASQQQPGEIGGSINFEGDTWAGLASSSSFSFERTDSFSLSGWYKIGSNTIGALMTKMPQPANAGWEFVQFQGASSPQIALGLFGTNAATGALAETPPVSMGVWHYIVATYSGTGNVAGMTIYVDGVQQTLTTMENNLATSILNNDAPAINSRALTASQESNDAMDEVRISAKGVVLTPAWVTATYNNESKPANFFTVVTGLTNP